VAAAAGGMGAREAGFFGESAAAAALYSESWRCDAAHLKLCRCLDLRVPPHALPIKRRGRAAAPAHQAPGGRPLTETERNLAARSQRRRRQCVAPAPAGEGLTATEVRQCGGVERPGEEQADGLFA